MLPDTGRGLLFAQLELDYRGSNLRRINDDDIMLDRYSAPRTTVDFMSSYQITDKLRLIFEVRNLVGRYAQGGRRGEKEYFGDGILLAEYGYDLRTYSFGLKFDL